MGGDAGDIYADSHTSMTLAKMLKRRKTRFIDYSHLLSVTWHGLRATQLIRFGFMSIMKKAFIRLQWFSPGAYMLDKI